MFQKTNQFHSSLKRYGEKEIIKFKKNKNISIFLGEVSDKFGNSGITLLLLVLKNSKKEIFIDSIIMSCRIFGRELETNFLNSIIKKKFPNFDICKIKYKKGAKNFLVKEFIKKFGFKKNKRSDTFILNIRKMKKIENYNIKCIWKKN